MQALGVSHKDWLEENPLSTTGVLCSFLRTFVSVGNVVHACNAKFCMFGMTGALVLALCSPQVAHFFWVKK